jgi:exopolysaccharide biosynthesis polyprenyl glycosylphosphotransferase
MDRGIWRVGDVPMIPSPSRLLGRQRWLWVGHLLLLAADAGLIYAGFALAYWLRYVKQLGRDVINQNFRELGEFTPVILALLAILLLLFEFKGLYRLSRRTSWNHQVGILISASTTGIALLVVGIFGFQKYFWSRLIFLYAWVTIVVLLSLFRILLRMFLRWTWRRGMGVERVVVLGATGLAQEIMHALTFDLARGSKLVGYLEDPEEQLASQYAPGDRVPCLGNVDEIEEVVTRLAVDHVIIALPFWAHHRLPKLVATCRHLDIEFTLAPDLYEVSFDRIDIDHLRGIPLVSLRENIIRGWNLALKRGLDLALILLVAPLWLPFWLLCAILIKLDSPGGPVLFSQERIGKGGLPFKVYKFRTMVPNAEELKQQLLAHNEADGPLFKIKNDPRVTRVGRFLRKLSLDELPQLLNVIRGEMSLVGPRPAVPEEVQQYSEWHRRRLEVTPGMTGLWQVMGRSNTSFDEMVRLDIYYTEHWSLLLDLRIIMLTVPAVVSGHGAY